MSVVFLSCRCGQPASAVFCDYDAPVEITGNFTTVVLEKAICHIHDGG